ncbi:hypothetical protein Pmar_PMAR003802, partial [Perkinsus marinus ATCC 50983]
TTSDHPVQPHSQSLSKAPAPQHVTSFVHQVPHEDHNTTASILPSHLHILATVQDLGWITLYLTYDAVKKTKCFTVEIKKGTIRPMNVAEYKRYGRLHTRMANCPKQDLEDSVNIWHKWQQA